MNKLIAISVSILWAAQLAAQSAPPTQWQLRDKDCEISPQSWVHRLDAADFRSAPSSETFHFDAGWGGSKIIAVCPVDPAYVINELDPSVWVKASRPEMRLMARVVLPHTRAPSGKGPITVLLEGPAYRNTGAWQRLAFGSDQTNVKRLLEQKIWLLRWQQGVEIDQRDAYVDLIAVNMYSGPGPTTVWLDDLHVEGSVSAQALVDKARQESTEEIQPAAWLPGAVSIAPDVRRDGTVLEVQGQPFFAQIIQHNGEPLALLRELGFNAVELRATATSEQLQEAQRLGLWLICPPPANAGLEPLGRQFDRVLAWSLGTRQTSRDLQRVREQAQQMRISDSRRPLVVHAASDWSHFGRVADILAVGLQPVGGSFALAQYSQWVRQCAQLVGAPMPIWVDVQTEMPEALNRQVLAMSQRLPPMPIDRVQMELAITQAVSGGARGIRFTSQSRLDAADPLTQLRLSTLRWANAQLHRLVPWMAGGAVVEDLSARAADQVTTVLKTNRSKLLLVQRVKGQESVVGGLSPLQTAVVEDRDSSASDIAYRLTCDGLAPLRRGAEITGSQIQLDDSGSWEAIVVTQDPTVVSRLTTLSSETDLLRSQADIVRQWLALIQLVDQQIPRQSGSPWAGAINEAVTYYQQAENMIGQSNLRHAHRALLQAEQRLAVARLSMLEAARKSFASNTSSPLLLHSSLVPLHYRLATRLENASWSANALAGGDFEDLQHMTQHGWSNHCGGDSQIQTLVELSAGGAVGGQRGLLLQTTTAPSAAGTLVESTPLWVSSAKIPVKSGQLVRIHGWVRIDRPIEGCLDGLMVIDSLGGPELGERIRKTDGWQEFCLYRAAERDGDLEITFALTGIGKALIDELTVRVADLPAEDFRQARGQ